MARPSSLLTIGLLSLFTEDCNTFPHSSGMAHFPPFSTPNETLTLAFFLKQITLTYLFFPPFLLLAVQPGVRFLHPIYSQKWHAPHEGKVLGACLAVGRL